MDRNTQAPYGEIDTIDILRSVWNRSFTHKTSFNAGYMIPFYVNTDILPGTTIKNNTSVVIRMSTPLHPVMDNLYLDTYYFKCSKFWYWNHFKAQMGENETSGWTQEIEYTTPEINVNTAYTVNDMATYIGMPIGVTGVSWDRMAVAGCIDIWNNWFRDQNLQAPIQIDKTDADLNSDNTINTGYGLLPVNKLHDYFTSCLPQAQKSPTGAITTPLGVSAPVTLSGNVNVYGNGKALGLWNANNNELGALTSTNYSASDNRSGSVYAVPNTIGGNMPYQLYPQENGTWNRDYVLGITSDNTNSGLTGNLNNVVAIADLTQATAATINALRLAVATQRIYEKDARYGTRYREILRGQWGVTASDEALMVPEYLGGKRIPINIETVLQQSQTSSQSPLGETGAFSVTTDYNEDFTKSFTKHDMLIGICCVRIGSHTYQQGIARQFKRQRRFDHFHQSFAFVGNQPVYNYEIFATGTAQDNEVFGYKEAWQEYLYTPNRISGMLLSTYDESLDTWHYGDDYDSLPVLSDQWIRATRSNIDRTLAIKSTEAHQFIADFYIEQTVAAPIPLNRVPGLLDHY